jgi:hypothetical protein
MFERTFSGPIGASFNLPITFKGTSKTPNGGRRIGPVARHVTQAHTSTL